jgi:hypothetical protein
MTRNMWTRRKATMIAGALIVLGCAMTARAQNVVMNSAETINRKNFKLGLFPTVLLGEDRADNEWGIAGRFGYGLARGFDVEAKLAVFDGLKYYGAEGEIWLVRNSRGVDASVAVGVHKTDLEEGNDVTGIDLTPLMSVHMTPKFEFYCGLMLGFESVENSGRDYTRAHFVPGFEYRVTDQMDFLVEYGLKLNDDSQSYVSLGVAIYFQ